LGALFAPGGFPACIADLEAQAVACIGLVPNHSYALTDGRQRVPGAADSTGTLVEPLFVKRGDSVALSNGSRTLTTLRVARLKATILGEETVLAGGSCQPGDYFGVPLSSAPTSTSAGLPTSTATGGAALSGAICPTNGDATGLPTASISQTDDLSGGLTQTEVPDVEDTSPIEGENLYGKFTALAESGLPGPNNSLFPTDLFTRIALTIARASDGRTVFTAPNVDTADGVSVSGLVPGAYTAAWTLTDANGDTRIVGTRFKEQLSSGPKATATCKLVGRLHHELRCTVGFPQLPPPTGTVRIRVARAGNVVALGHGRLRKGKATITMRELRQVSKGAWRITLVLSRPHKAAQTVTLGLKKVV
jgi:hypothetical protein